MMGRTHATSGAVAYLALIPAARLAGLHASPVAAVVGACVAAGGALLPDLDHPSSKAARSLGLLTRALAVFVNRVSGGHRQATHSLLGVGVFTVLAAILDLTVRWLPYGMVTGAILLGCVMHVLGDMLTVEGCPLLWPHQHRFRLLSLRTDGWVERWLIGPLLGVLAVVLGAQVM